MGSIVRNKSSSFERNPTAHRAKALRLGAASTLVVALLCSNAFPAFADELSELRAQIKAMRAASVAVEKRLAKLEHERVAARKASAAAPTDSVPSDMGLPKLAELVTSSTPGYYHVPGTDTSVKLGGFIKIDGVYDVHGGGIGGVATDFREIPLRGTPASRRSPDFQSTARQSQLQLSTITPTAWAGDVKTYVAFDFYGAPNGNGLYTNSYTARLFQAYVTLDKFAGGSLLVGQAWSTAMDLDSYPETLDINGPVGPVFIRQPQVRYVYDFGGGSKAYLAVEAPYGDFEGANPYPVFTAGGAQSSNIVDPIPDLVAKYTYDGSWGHFALAGIGRYIKADTGGVLVNNFQGSSGVAGGGGMIGVSVKTFGKDSINAQAVGGSGIGRYLFGEDDSGGSAASLVPCGSNPTVACGLRATTAYGATASYQHYWTDKLRSNFVGGYAHYDNEFPDDPTQSTKRVISTFGNLIYSPTAHIDVGLEYIWGYYAVAASPGPGIKPDASASRVLGSIKVGY